MLKLLEIDSNTLYNSIISAMEMMTGEPLYPGDERRIFTEALVQIVASVVNSCNSACNGKMLQYATDDALDALGYRMGVERLEAVPATATFRFTLAAAQSNDITVPEGTLITTDGDIYFATDGDLTIAAGATYGDVTGTCTTPGEDGNGYGTGAVAQLVDLIDKVSTAVNTTMTAGGANREDDEEFRERIHLANSTFSCAGPTKAYQYYAKSADPSIIDVVVDSPDPCEIVVYVLTNTGVPSQTILDKVEAICSADDIRPLTDQVTVSAPSTVSYDISVKYYTTAEDEADCVAAIEGDGGAIDQYKEWQEGAIGRNINPNKLMALCMSPPTGVGCLRMDITAPTAATVGDFAVAQIGTVTVTHEVVTE